MREIARVTKPPGSEPPRPEHPFAPYVRILGRGRSGTRSLSMAEAADAFGMVLRGDAEPLQVGAFLMLLRVKEETGEELAGFVNACREQMVTPLPNVVAELAPQTKTVGMRSISLIAWSFCGTVATPASCQRNRSRSTAWCN